MDCNMSMIRLRRVLPFLLAVSCLFLVGCGSVRITGTSEIGSVARPGSETALRAVRSAQTQLGKLYRSGGSSPRTGFDCSGLIWWAYRQHGVNVPRVTTDQARAGYAVSRSQARPGDILVFKTSSGSRGLHTALYAGQGRFIHSPSTGKRIRYDKMNNSYWNKKLIRIRRVTR